MRKQELVKTILFAVFFSAGAASFGLAILIDDLFDYYQSRRHLERARQNLKKVQALEADYTALADKLQKEPNILRKLGPSTFGTETNDTNAAYPKISAEQLSAAKEAIKDEPNGAGPDFGIPT